MDRQAVLLLAHARKSSPEYQGFRGAVHAHPFFHDGVFLCHNGTVRDVERLGTGMGTDSRRILLWLSRNWRPRTPERLAECLAALLNFFQDWSALNLLISEGAGLYALCAYTRDPDYFTLWVHRGPGLVAVASEPADLSKPWEPLANGEVLLVPPSGACTRIKL